MKNTTINTKIQSYTEYRNNFGRVNFLYWSFLGNSKESYLALDVMELGIGGWLRESQILSFLIVRGAGTLFINTSKKRAEKNKDLRKCLQIRKLQAAVSCKEGWDAALLITYDKSIQKYTILLKNINHWIRKIDLYLKRSNIDSIGQDIDSIYMINQ